VGRGYSQPDLSMDRVEPDRFVIADRRVESIARPWVSDGGALFLTGGERAKTLPNALKVIKTLLRREHERKQPLVAIGGGSICDLAGFAAAVYKRGIPLHLVPTTLLAQVDAAIGGKNGVDLPEGKNLLGTIRQPDTVLVDPVLLGPLPDREFSSGLAEVVKCGMIRDFALFELLERKVDALIQDVLPRLPPGHQLRRRGSPPAGRRSRHRRQLRRRRLPPLAPPAPRQSQNRCKARPSHALSLPGVRRLRPATASPGPRRRRA